MTKILAVGCSITKGHGLCHEENDPKLWVNQLINSTFRNPSILNLATTARNNHWIFTETSAEIIKNDYDVVIVGWTAIDRLNINIGLELYPTCSMLKNIDVNINPNITIKGKTLEKLGNEIHKLKNTHWNILELIKYINILYYIQVTVKKSKLFFVNALSSYPETYFQYLNFTKPSDLDVLTQDLLNVKTRSNDEIKKLYNMIHEQYSYYGGIHKECWLNLNCALNKLTIDTISDTDAHPGYKSQDIFANYLIPILKEKLQ
jgi:hypothetical protein